ncbi:hypothetical protein [Amaricoccus macauensis]|uniref:hypothetical protein n=1 Tax=Amaricoccus macauensis TaxID=57001 RepID=UPI003C7B7E32
MHDLIRRLLIVWAVTFVAVSVMLSPANAVEMIDCDSHVSASVTVEGHDHNVDVLSGHDEMQHQHPESHCASHACVLGVAVAPTDLMEIGPLPDMNRRGIEPSLNTDALLEGLQRPPRA